MLYNPSSEPVTTAAILQGAMVPRKLRELIRDLQRAGFVLVTGKGKGSHQVFEHPEIPEVAVTLSGASGDDARHYQERDVREAVQASNDLKRVQ